MHKIRLYLDSLIFQVDPCQNKENVQNCDSKISLQTISPMMIQPTVPFASDILIDCAELINAVQEDMDTVS